MRWCRLARAAALCAASAGALGAQERLVNGGFETGSLAGWTVETWPGSSGAVSVASGAVSPTSAQPVPGPRTGGFYALTDQTGPGAYAISQSFTIAGPVTSATLRFSLSPANRFSTNVVGANFDPVGAGPNQHVSVDLFAGAVSGFAPNPGLANFFLGGVPGATGAVPYTDYVFDLTGLLAPGTYTLRFAETDNQFFYQMAVDDVSLVVTGVVPEPATVLLLGAGLAGVLLAARRRTRG